MQNNLFGDEMEVAAPHSDSFTRLLGFALKVWQFTSGF